VLVHPNSERASTNYYLKAKSNVVNMNRATAVKPPQSENVDAIGDLSQTNGLIYQAEYFARNIAAVGQCESSPFPQILPSEICTDFGETADIFNATATMMQELLAGVTPVEPITPPLPNDFNNWLRGVVMGYPNGCT
jgi:hypothetical protein